MESSNVPPDERDREAQVPEPGGDPIAEAEKVMWGVGTVLAIGAGIFIAPAFLSVGRTSGATRSARLEWERRSEAIAAAEASELAANEPTRTNREPNCDADAH